MIEKITLEWLNCTDCQEIACEEGIDLFKEVFGEQANLIDVINYCIGNYESNN